MESKEYFEEIPYQNNEIHYPQILMYLGMVKKELSIINKSIDDDYLEIEKIFLESIDYFDLRNNDEKLINVYLELGELFFKLSDYEKAYFYLEKGVDLIEKMRNSIKDIRLRKIFFDRINKMYELIILSSFYLNRKNDVLKFIELSKHRIFLDEISKRQENQFFEVNSEIINELSCIQSKISLIENKLYNLDKINFKYSSNYVKFFKLNKLKEYYLTKLKEDYPKYYNYYYAHFLNYDELDLKDITLIEYYYTDTCLLIILIESNKFIMKKIDFENNKINELIDELKSNIYQSYENNKYLKELDNILEKIHDIVFDPIKDEVSSENLIIIPYKKLHNIPFYCLKDDEYLIDKYIISILQSLSSMEYIKNNYSKSKNNDCLVIGNPTCDLKYAKKEAINISNILETEPILEKKANKSNIIKRLENKRIIHYAGHGRFIPENNSCSYLKLHDQNLYLYDLEKINLNSELIVLSACETAIVSINPSDESEGFIQCLQVNGAKYIIAPLWNVDDLKTQKLFEIFYSLKYDFPECLRYAELKLKKENNVLEWGAFQIYGV